MYVLWRLYFSIKEELVIIIYFVEGNILLIAVSYVLYKEERSSMLGFNVVSSMRNKCESHYGIIDFSSLDRSFVVLERSKLMIMNKNTWTGQNTLFEYIP